ncbi:MAG: hypothetical protein GX359_05580 [Clostridiales bacterium]|nr:hypothetical protein [Clostridiales bacterium]
MKTSRSQDKSYLIILLLFLSSLLILLNGCKSSYPSHQPDGQASSPPLSEDADSLEPSLGTTEEQYQNSDHTFLNPEGTTLESRINPPSGYARIPSDPKELTSFIRRLPLKEDGSKVLLYNGEEKRKQNNHIAVFDIKLSNRDLQQCADSIIRIYAEYYWFHGEYDKIAFHLTNGFYMEYTKWREGNRLQVEGNDVYWVKSQEYNDSYEEFLKYLDMVFAYAGTLSLVEECEPVTIEELRPGDMILQGGSPGHCVLIVDIAEDIHGNRCFLLAQGYMPAQDFHILKNPLNQEDPWYCATDITFPLTTPSWTFNEGATVRWANFPLNESNKALTFTNKKQSSFLNDRDNKAIPAMSDNMLINGESESSQVALLAVGDNLIHTEVIESGKQPNGQYNYNHLYANIKSDISAADIAIINQETILGGDDFEYTGYPAFNSPTEIGEAIVEAGFDVVLHATNHTLDKKLQGVLNTFAFWQQYPQITILGINETKQQRDEIKIVEMNGIKLAMLNYTYGLNGYRIPDDMPYLVNMLDMEQMAKDIEKAESIADFTIVFPHWGTEYVYEPTNAQKELCKFFFNHGVDLVIGTHPHVLEPVEWMETDDHRMLIYYSLGNFISYQKEAPRMLGGMATVTITKNEDNTFISDAGIIPIITHYENGPSDYNYAIYKLSEYTPELTEKHGVSDLAKNGPLSYTEIYTLAENILGDWFYK